VRSATEEQKAEIGKPERSEREGFRKVDHAAAAFWRFL
jgi:hypothetical protein